MKKNGPQALFLNEFRNQFERDFGPTEWAGGQGSGNTAGLPPDATLRAQGAAGNMENFELGDLRTDFKGRTIVIEYDDDGPSLLNLAKYWPYIRGELFRGQSTVIPPLPLILCHFSNWSSYGSWRLMWKWLYSKISEDRKLLVDFLAEQFDHGRDDTAARNAGIQSAIEWFQSMGLKKQQHT